MTVVSAACRSHRFARLPFLLCLVFACTSPPVPDTEAAVASSDYEIWAMDQGTHVVHVYHASFEQVASIDLGAQGARVPHMIEFTSDLVSVIGAADAPWDGKLVEIMVNADAAEWRTARRSHRTIANTGWSTA